MFFNERQRTDCALHGQSSGPEDSSALYIVPEAKQPALEIYSPQMERI